jgi:hypothetical protein
MLFLRTMDTLKWIFNGRLNRFLIKRGFGPIIEVKVMPNDPIELVLALILAVLIMIFEELK